MKTTVAEVIPPARFGAKRLYRDAGSLASSSVANAFLGIAFWALAAKLFAPERLGVMTAVLSVITSVGAVLASGVGDAYTALLPAAGADRADLYRRGQRLFLALALGCGLVAAVATVGSLPEVRWSIEVGVLVVCGIVAWSTLTLQNATLVALGRARWLPIASIAASGGKIAFLPLLAVLTAWHPVELSVVISAGVVVVVMRAAITRIIRSDNDLPPSAVPGGPLARRFNVFVAQTFVSSALSMGVLMLTPFLVTVFSSPAQGALFALSLSIVQALDFIGAALAMSLVVHASSAPEEAGAMARRTMIRAVGISSVGAVVLVIIAPTMLRLLNPQYGALGATGVIAALSAGSVIRCIYMVWSGLQRARRQMVVPLVLNVLSAVVLLVLMPFFTRGHGAFGGAMAISIAQAVLIAGIGVHFLAGRQRWRSATPSAGSAVI